MHYIHVKSAIYAAALPAPSSMNFSAYVTNLSTSDSSMALYSDTRIPKYDQRPCPFPNLKDKAYLQPNGAPACGPAGSGAAGERDGRWESEAATIPCVLLVLHYRGGCIR